MKYLLHPRTAIRTYVWDMLKDKVDVGGRVFLNRPNAVIITELPCVNIYFNAEPVEVKEGDRYIPQMYERKLSLVIDVLDEQPTDPNKLMRVEDKLDFLARQIEREFANDVFFMQRLPGYEGKADDSGLIAGARLLSTTPDSLELGSDRTLAVQSLNYELTYNDEAFIEPKLSIIESYLMQINRIHWNEETIDPTLIEAEGSFFLINELISRDMDKQLISRNGNKILISRLNA